MPIRRANAIPPAIALLAVRGYLWGLVSSPEEHKALLALAESVAGAREVSDEMTASYLT